MRLDDERGASMTRRRLITVRDVVHRELISFKPKSFSSGYTQGRWTWVGRSGPLGRSGFLWVDIDGFAAWLRLSGQVVPHDWAGLEAGAVVVEEKEEAASA